LIKEPSLFNIIYPVFEEGNMITGAHIIIYSTDPEKDREFFRDILKFPFIDIGDGWLIFRLPQSEAAIHPSEENNPDEFYLMCDDINELSSRMKELNVKSGEIEEHAWGRLIKVKLPGGGDLKIYQSLHESPPESRQ
jgi:catechol 2,3-dioxygenase-like lactoylglutathione lyase family enzyme